MHVSPREAEKQQQEATNTHRPGCVCSTHKPFQP